MEEKEVNLESVLGIPVFTWDGWDEAGDQDLQFYNVKFLLKSLEKYNGNTVFVKFGWNVVKIYEDKNVISVNLFEVPEFIKELMGKMEQTDIYNMIEQRKEKEKWLTTKEVLENLD